MSLDTLVRTFHAVSQGSTDPVVAIDVKLTSAENASAVLMLTTPRLRDAIATFLQERFEKVDDPRFLSIDND